MTPRTRTSRVRTLARIAATSAPALLLLACGDDSTTSEKISQPAAAKPAGREAPRPTQAAKPYSGAIDIQTEGDAVKISGKDSQGAFTGQFGGSVGLPENFPSDIPPYPGARTIAAVNAPGAGTMATFETADAPDDVVAYYQQQLGEMGWSVAEKNRPREGERVLAASKGKRRITTAVTGATGSARITITVEAGS